MRPPNYKEIAMNKTFATTKKFVVKHQVAIAVVATAVVCMTITRAGLKQHNEFLKEHGLYDAFYQQED
jgi:hypothetical protein